MSLTPVVAIALYPLSSLFTNAAAFLKTLWNSRVLFNGDWNNYNMFSANQSNSFLFYNIMALNFLRYGRLGRSPYMALGDYPMSNLFHITLPSIYAYHRSSNVTILAGILLFGLSHLIWWNGGGPVLPILAVTGLFLISSINLLNLRENNYNMWGWAIFPLVIYGLLHQHYWMVAACLFGISFLSITIVFISCLAIGLFGLWNLDVWMILTCLPAAVKVLLHLVPSMMTSSLGESAGSLLKIIGSIRGKGEKKAVFKRGDIKLFNLPNLYLLACSLQFVAVAFWLRGELPVVMLIAIGIFVLNQGIARFADPASVYMLLAGTCMAVVLQEFDWWLLASAWVLMNPFPLFIGFFHLKRPYNVIPAFRPVNIAAMRDRMTDFLRPVAQDQRVHFALEDPKGVYERIYDGYKVLLHLAFYTANVQRIHLMPDYWAVFQTNYEGAPNLWGREPEAVEANLERWQADFAIVYQESSRELDPVWEARGFRPVASFDWQDYVHLGFHFEQREAPVWWLLQKPENPSSQS